MTKTKLNRAHKDSDSLRTTIPTWVAETLELGVGDSIHWKLDRKTGRIYVEPITK